MSFFLRMRYESVSFVAERCLKNKLVDSALRLSTYGAQEFVGE